jgi:hypothetical protein
MPEVNHRAKNMLSLVHGGRLTSIFGTPACGGTEARLALRRPLGGVATLIFIGGPRVTWPREVHAGWSFYCLT